MAPSLGAGRTAQLSPAHSPPPPPYSAPSAPGPLGVRKTAWAGGWGRVASCVCCCYGAPPCAQVQGGVWLLSPGLCDALMAMDVMLCTASIFNLCAISVDR